MKTSIWIALLVGCGDSPEPHGHPHGPSGEHDAGSDGTIAATRWTDTHELFVELDAPVVGQRFAYGAHVTDLADNNAVTTGQLTARFSRDGFVVESHSDDAVARPGIFAGEASAPAEPGDYALTWVYTDGDSRSEWDVVPVTVTADGAQAHPPEAAGEIGFLKESQWQIPFRVAVAAALPIAPSVTAAAVVHPAPDATTVVASPVEGLLVWSQGLPVVGRHVQRGERLATLIPAGAAEHWSRLQADLATARVDRDLAGKELTRVEDLAGRDLLPTRRLEEAQADVDRAAAQVSSTQRRVSALTTTGAGAVPIAAPADGLVVAVGGHHGVAVAAGTPLVSVATGPAMLIEGRVYDRDHVVLSPVVSLTVLRGDWAGPVDLLAAGGRLLTERLVFGAETLSAPVAVLVDADVGLVAGDLVELRIAIGEGRPRLAVPRSAVVEINGQDVVFVQKTGESFTRRRVTLGDADATHVEVRSGVDLGDRVVVEGGFDVHVASLSGALESHRH